jgi:uncharacterized glyoxalase superfamily protein PhnB
MTPQTIFPTLRYRDARAAIDWLKEAAGFEALSVMEGEDGAIQHAELAISGNVLMLSTWSGEGEDPFVNSRSVTYVAIDDPDAHHERATAAGAKVVMELTDQPYGSREYAISDPEDNVWCFGTYRPEAKGD